MSLSRDQQFINALREFHGLEPLYAEVKPCPSGLHALGTVYKGECHCQFGALAINRPLPRATPRALVP